MASRRSSVATVQTPDGPRKLGNNRPPANRLRMRWRSMTEVENVPLIDRAQFPELVKAIGDGPEVPFDPRQTDQDGVGQCFPAGTLIRMADGSQRPIEQVRVTEEVLTAEGNVRPVLRTMARKETESLYRLHAWGHRHLRGTGEHPVLTDRGYVRLGEIKAGDFVACPRYAPSSKIIIMPSDYIDGRTYTSRASGIRHMQIPGKAAMTIVRNAPPDTVHLTEDFGWVVGLFLAEGSTSSGKATWALSLAEAETHGAKLVRLLRECLGIEANLRTNEARNVTIVSAYGVCWAKLFEAWCAKGSGSKQLHPDLAAGPVEFLRGVLTGWTDGDGIGDKLNGGVTISHTLAVQMFDAANALGLRPTIETLDVKTYGAVRTRRKRYQVRWGKHPEREDWRSRQDDKHLWRKVDGVVREDFAGWVFNLEVEGDNSYVAEGVGVHNCNANATITAIEAERKQQGLPEILLSPADLYDRINGGGDNGSMLEDGIAEAMARGVGTEATCGSVWRRGQKQASAGERARFRVLEAYLCPTFDHCFSAVCYGFKLISGVVWYGNYEPDEEGWLPNGRGEVGGHAVYGFKPAWRNGKPGIWHKNSWGSNWGRNGFVVFPEAAYRGPVGGWWAVRGVTDEGGVVPLPKQLAETAWPVLSGVELCHA